MLQRLDVSAFVFIEIDQFHLLFMKGLHHRSCPCSSLASWFFYMLATMKNTRQGNAFSHQRRSVIFLQVTCFFLLSGVCLNILVAILIITFLHNFAFNAGTFYLALFFQVRLRGCMLLIYLSLLTIYLGRYWIISPGIWNQNSALLPWVVPGIYASGLVHWILATADS